MRLKAILPQFSAFVSASAGTGKTKTLIDRLINLLLNHVKPHKILCLTFTKAAASEILNRINQRLAEFTICSREKLLKELQDLGLKDISPELEHKARILFAEFVDAAEPLNIQTIHAFCQQLLTKFPFESGVNLNFTLLTDGKINELIEQAKNILLNSPTKYSQAGKAISYLSWHMKEYSLAELLTEIISNREKLDHYFTTYNQLNLDISNDEDNLASNFISKISINHSHVEILNSGGKNDIDRANKLILFLNYPTKLKIMLIQDYLSLFLNLNGDMRKSLTNKNLSDRYPEFYHLLLEEQQRAYQFNRDFKDIKTKNLTQAFLILSYYLRKIYQQLKEQHNALDYDDLISHCFKLLNNSEYADWIRYKLDGGLDHILIDEAQDNSFNQWEIINKISEEFFYQSEVNKSLFIVGDAKQSIFSFQGAEPELFSSMNHHLPNNILRLSLNTSFRSGRVILNLVDRIFNQAHIKPLVSIEEKINHIAFKDIEGNIELWPLIIEEKNEKQKTWELPSEFLNTDKTDISKQLAKKIATNIKQWLESKKFIHSKNRSIIPSDILVLTRRRNNFVHCLIRELRKLNIPVAGLDRLKLIEHPAILDLIALSNFLLCKSDDLNLAIVLKSPIANFLEEKLLHLCYNRKGSLWQTLSESLEHQNTYNFLKGLEPKSIFEFYFDLIEYKNLRNIFIEAFGIEASDVLDSFLDLAAQFEKENIASLQLFINFIGNSNLEIKRDLSQNTEQVQIMTIHGAKGLQAPIVILSDTTSLPYNDESIIWLSGQELLWPGKSKYYSEIALKAKADKTSKEYAEYLRLLYVALTRAEDELIITGTSKTQEISPKSWYAIIQNQIN